MISTIFLVALLSMWSKFLSNNALAPQELSMNRFKTLVLFTFVVLAFASCNKCYDKALKEEYQNVVCRKIAPVLQAAMVNSTAMSAWPTSKE